MTQKDTPDRIFLTPSGGLPTGNWPKNELVAFIKSTPTREAAPELLEALEYIVAFDDMQTTAQMEQDGIDKARAAIAKAKGEAG